MNAHLYRRLEIAFWDFAIQTLTENLQVRAAIQSAYRLIHLPDMKRFARLLVLTAAAGLISGFLLCAISIYMR